MNHSSERKNPIFEGFRLLLWKPSTHQKEKTKKSSSNEENCNKFPCDVTPKEEKFIFLMSLEGLSCSKWKGNGKIREIRTICHKSMVMVNGNYLFANRNHYNEALLLLNSGCWGTGQILRDEKFCPSCMMIRPPSYVVTPWSIRTK